MTTDLTIAILGACAVVIAAIIKMIPQRLSSAGCYVLKEVCDAQHAEIMRTLTELKSDVKSLLRENI